MPKDLQAVPLYCGGRRHRFMESTDFNGAALHFFRSLRRVVDASSPYRPSFVGFDVDSTTPGHVLATTPLELQRPDILAAMSLRRGLPEAVDAAFRALQSPTSPYALIGFVCLGKELGVAERSVYLELRSEDQRAVASYRFDHHARRLKYSPLTIRPPLGRAQPPR